MTTELFTFLQTKIATIGSVKHIDWWNNQPLSENEEDAFECPAVFIEVLPYNTMSLGRKRLSAEIDFVLHLVQVPIKRTRKGHRQQADALSRLKTDDLIIALKGKTNNSSIGSIQIGQELPDNNYQYYNDTRLACKVRMTSDVAAKPTAPATGKGEVTHINQP